MLRFFRLKGEQKGAAALKHVKGVFNSFLTTRNNLANLRATVSLSGVVCDEVGLQAFNTELDAFDASLREAVDNLAVAISTMAVGAGDLEAASIMVQKMETGNQTLSSMVGTAPPKASPTPAPAAESKPETTSTEPKKPALQQLLQDLKNSASPKASGGSLPAAE